MEKRKKGLIKKIFIGGLATKILFLTPLKANCPDVNYNSSVQQNLKKIEYANMYEKREDIPTNQYNYGSSTKPF